MSPDAAGFMLAGGPDHLPDKIIIQRRPLTAKPNQPWTATCGRCSRALPAYRMRATSHATAVMLGVRHARVFHSVTL